ncbi:MAG: HRDC domain-containing protein [Candidatus Izimaplasma sp.]|nr:HRDC domain-containing protein [Candidatus Izimaplasma bacterium]
MALQQDKLLYELDKLRDNLHYHHHLKSPTAICSDNALREIAEKMPLKASDFLAISGINQIFIKRYGTDFLQVIKTYNQTINHEKSLTKDAYQVLDHYKDRLTNLNRRNKNLYMGRTTKRHSIDMTLLTDVLELKDFLTNNHKKVINLPDTDDTLYRHVTTLYREVNKQEKELGSYELYLAYPYIEGVFKQDSFALRAPLAYIPVKMIRDKKQFKIKKDDEKDIVLNRDLLLATQKFLQSTISDSPFIKKLDKRTLVNEIIPFFESTGLNIKRPKINYDFTPFESYRKDDFRKQRSGVFHISEMMVLGRYKRHSSMIQRDMDHILDQKTYNDLLEGLIEEDHLYDIEKRIPFDQQNIKINEAELAFLSEVNYSQEHVIQALNHTNKLVIWGPPGTGKSQTITNLIASRILKGENVLVVSEKKVALDVIYSRLKQLSDYTLFLDDAEDKQSFFHQLEQFIDPAPPIRTISNDIDTLEDDIEALLQLLDEALTLIYDTKLDNVPIHKLYDRYIIDRKVNPKLTPKTVYQILKDTFKQPTVALFEKFEKTFRRNKRLRELIAYDKIIKQYGHLKQFNLKLTRSEQVDFKAFHQAYDEALRDYEDTWVFKGHVKRKFIRNHKKALRFFIPKRRHHRKYLTTLFTDDTLHQFFVTYLGRWHLIQKHYNALDAEMKQFVRLLHTNQTLSQIDNIASHRKYLFDAFYTGFLEAFEAEHQGVIETLKTVHEDQLELEKLHNQKKQMDYESVAVRLYEEALHLSHTKRIMDIKRLLESKHKMSVPAFVSHFQLEILNHIKIWLMTPETVSAILPLVYGMFDTVIFDEASQLYVEKGIPAIYRAKKVVIAGDTKQLRPSSLGMGRLEDLDEYYEEDELKDLSIDAKSLLDLARYKYQEIILNYHYRSRYEELIAFSNHAFYQANLFVAPNQQLPDKPPIEYVYVKDAIYDNRQNEKEAKKVIALIRKLFRERQHNESIGVITFNSSQRDLIENHIDEELFKRGKYQKLFEQELYREEDNEDQSLFVKNIENVQGDERDIIIFSMGYGKDIDGKIHRRFGWLNQSGGENRLNVAITRAKQKIYFVSSLTPEELKVDDLKSTGPKLVKDYMRYCMMISRNHHQAAETLLNQLYQKDDAKEVLKTDLISDLEIRLSRTETIHTNIGIGNFKIDLAIYNTETSAYKLAILCDVLSRNTRKDIYHQTNYLKARGWEVYRVFSSEYYKDPNKVIREIRKQYDH